MKKCVNGIYVEMSQEEISEMEKERAEMPTHVPSPEERLQKLEEENKQLKAMLAKLSGEVTANA